MKLAKLELSGFKSFADYTEFVFDDGITGIVGPNGCGKSNVVDATKWVLGEMSAKSLRGDGMLDVIFNGSGARKPMGMAEVSLTFTNEDRKLPLDTELVKITRRLYRDATSEYLINGQMSRLKDIRELFLDTGVGVDAYSLIEQGRVMGLLESNPAERREIFEEAAGISRFKQRKKEAQRKLEKTDLNLAQSQLVIDEVDKQLRSVKMQAGKARNYQEYATRLKELRSAYVMQEYGGLFKKASAVGEQLDTIVDSAAVVRRELEEKRARQTEAQLELDAVQHEVRRAERELLQAQNDGRALEQQRTFAQQQMTQLTEQIALQKQRQGELQERNATRQREASEHEAALAAIDEKLRAHEAEVTQASARQAEAAKAIAGLQRSVDERKARAIELMRQIARGNNVVNGLRITQENLTNQKTRLEQRRDTIIQQAAELEAKMREAETRRDELAATSATLQAEAQAVREQQQENNQKQSGISQDLARQREQRSALTSRRNVLVDLQAKREGVSQVVRDVLKSRDAGKGFAYITGMVADELTVDLHHAPVIEAALGDWQNALIVTDSAALAADRAAWQTMAGRVKLLPLDRMPAYQDVDWAEHGEGVVRAIDLVRPSEALGLLMHQLLGRTAIVETLAEALALAENGPRGIRVVTRAGEVIDSGRGVCTLELGDASKGDASKRGGMISRRAEVTKLETELAAVEESVNVLTAQIAQCDAHSRALDAQQQMLRQKIYQTDSAKAEAAATAQQSGAQWQRTKSEGPLLTGEIESITRQIGISLEQQQAEEAKNKTLEEEQKAAEAAVHELGAQVIVRQHEVSELSEVATKARVAMGQVQEQRSGLSRALATARQAVAQGTMEIERLRGEVETVEARIETARRSAAEAEGRQGEIAERVEKSQAELNAATAQCTKLREESSGVIKQVETLQSQLDVLGRQEHELALQKSGLAVRLETLITHTQEELGIDLTLAYMNYVPAEMDWDAVAEEINDLKGKMQRLGNVNIDAISEQTQLEERAAFLTAQLADITDAKRQLEELIGKINDDSRTRFAETFAAVRIEFQEMFRKLFGGGKADLILENPDDILESGIEVLAKPPGKELQSISLLSGGEKTMTAVALVLSVFKSKPSPFCILDEVDAALDEANTARFAAIVQEFLAHSQFIVITHNKRTMSVANTLYGVTMQEQGVSKRVAVKFDGKGNAHVPATGGTNQSAAA
jgi:chromosome segregation protein